ncbi:hypothetical protein ACHAWX_007657 [Stephanocyclus meneghinianus]
MSYQLPLSERIRIQFEILCENCADCFSALSGTYKRPIFFLASCALFFTLRSARKSIHKAKMGGALGGYGTGGYSSTAGYGSSLYGGSSSSLMGGSSLYGGYGSGSSTGGGLMGGSSTSYGVRGASPSINTGYGSSMGASSFGSTFGGGGGGKGTANLVDANPSVAFSVDPSVRFHDYGGALDFYGQVDIIQAFDAPSFVSQIISQPGQSKVLVIDGGGSMNSALFDADMANTAMRNGWKGVIVNGAVRNSGQLSKIPFGVKALGTNPMKGRGMNGQRGAVVSIGSTQLQNGLWVYADGDGIIMSQSDISGGSFGGGSSMQSSGSSMGSSVGTIGGYGASNSLTGSGYGGSSSSFGAGGVGSASYAGTSLTGGYGPSSSMGSSLTGGYGSNTMGGSSYGTSPGSTYSSSGYGGSSLYGNSGYGSSSPYSYGRSSMYSSRRKKHKMFKILLATSIAAIIWIVCLK